MIWLTCCALHNMLLEIDGLDAPWDGSQINTSEWEGDLGEPEPDDVPLTMRHVYNPKKTISIEAVAQFASRDRGVVLPTIE